MRRGTTASDALSPHGYSPHRGDSGKFPWHSQQIADAHASATVNGSGAPRSFAILAVFLTDERHANLLRLIPPVVMTPNRTLVSPKTRTLVRLESPRQRASTGKGLQEVRRRSHIRHCGVEPQVVPIWIKEGWHPVVDCSGHGVCCCGQDRAGFHPVSTGVFRAIPDSSECEQLPPH